MGRRESSGSCGDVGKSGHDSGDSEKTTRPRGSYLADQKDMVKTGASVGELQAEESLTGGKTFRLSMWSY